jgi:PAS domain S-box-containing protein
MNECNFNGITQALQTSLATLRQQVCQLPQTSNQSEQLTHTFETLQIQLDQLISTYDSSDHQKTVDALHQSERRFQRLIANMPGMVYRYLPCAGDSDAFMYVNHGCRDLFELEPHEVLQNAGSVWALIHPDDLPSLQQSVAIAVEHCLPWQWEGRVITPSGQLKWIQGRSRPEPTVDGDVWDGLLIDISDRKQAEAQIQAALREKEVLLNEIHHRVKNNLQIISSLLYLQGNRLNNRDCIQVLQHSRERIELMALVHENLYHSQNFSEIDFSEYIQQLVIKLFQTYNFNSNSIELIIKMAPGLTLNMERAIPCALIINELMTNAIQHGFYDGKQGSIFVEATATPDRQITILIGNSGDTLPTNFNLQSIQSVGLKLVSILVKQLDGTLDIERGKNTCFRITFQV